MRIGHVMDHMGLGGAQTIVRDLVDRNENHYLRSRRHAKNEMKLDNSKSCERVNTIKNRLKYSLLIARAVK